MGDANDNGTISASAFFHPKKRTRTETEVSNSQSNSQNNSRTPSPLLQINSLEIDDSDLRDTTSTETVISNPSASAGNENINRHGTENRDKENLAFKWDKLNDKKCRFESHEGFLKKCLENDVIPNSF